MWEEIKPGKDSSDGVMWIVNGLRKGSLIWAMDGSNNRKKAVDLCSVGWIIFCTDTGFCVTGTFWEQSPAAAASSYKAELLGLSALHQFAQAISEFHKVAGWSVLLFCNNNLCKQKKWSAKINFGCKNLTVSLHKFIVSNFYAHFLDPIHFSVLFFATIRN